MLDLEKMALRNIPSGSIRAGLDVAIAGFAKHMSEK